MPTTKRHGVGFTLQGGKRPPLAQWEQFGKPAGSFPIDFTAEPWGPDGGTGRVSARDDDAFVLRYGAGDRRILVWSPIGNANERFAVGERALSRAFEAGRLGSPAEWDGIPSTREVYDLAVTTHRGTGLYAEFPDVAPGEPAPPPPPAPPVEPPAPAPVPPTPPAPPPGPSVDKARQDAALVALARVRELIQGLGPGKRANANRNLMVAEGFAKNPLA